MSYATLVKLSEAAAKLTASACASCAKNDPMHHCCNGCARAHGYFGAATKAQFDAIKLKYGWDDKLGFATTVGCRLPREVRSPTCLAFYCNPIRQSPPVVGFEGCLQRLRDEKGFKEAVLPDGLARLLNQAMTDAAAGHRESVDRAIEGRNAI